MSVLHCLEWVLSSHTIITTCLLLMFSFGILFKLIRS